jgi:pimeloyl-ACP methyl ester carboxylesterase
MPFANIANQKIYYAETGSARNVPPIVFVHGSGANHLAWGLQLRPLGEVTRVIALDLPGHGKSDLPGRTTVEGYRDAVLGLLDSLNIERAVIAGHSLGGAIAQTFALAYPERAAGLGLVGTGARLRVLPTILDGILHDFEQTTEFVVDHAYSAGLDPSLRARAVTELRACPAQVTHDDYAACNAFDVMARVAEIRVPTIAICGKQDEMTPPKYSEFLVGKIPGARLVVIDHAGHSVMIEQAEQVNRALIEFVKGL